MTSRVSHSGGRLGPNEIFLNTTRFRLAKGTGVTSSSISQYPPKLILGDYNKDSHQNISVFTWNDQRDGIGIDRIGPGQEGRCNFTECNIRHKGHLTFTSSRTISFSPNTDGIPLISQLGSDIVTAFGTSVESGTGGAWTARRTLDAAPTDVMNGNLGGTEFLVFAIGTGYEYSSAVATWAQSTKDALNIEFWHDRFWGIDATGQLWYTYTMGSAEVDDAQLLLSNGEVVTGLLRARAPNQEFILYAVTSKGLYAHDNGNRRFVRVEGIVLPNNTVATHERPAVTWRERIYLAAGRGLIEYDPVAATLRRIGFNLDDGMPVTFDGRVSYLAASTEELFVGTDAVSSNDTSRIMAWDGRGWSILPVIGDREEPVHSLHISDIGGYRLWWSDLNSNLHRVNFTELPDGFTRPANIDGYTYDKVLAKHRYPVFDAFQSDITKVLLRLKVEVTGTAAAETVTVLVAIDGGSQTELSDTHTNDSTFNAGGDHIDGDGTTTFSFPSVASPSGTAFRDLQVELKLAGTTATLSPDVLSTTIEYFKVLDSKLAFDFDLDLLRAFSGNSPRAARALLVTAAETAIMVELTFKADTGNTRNYFVNVKTVSGMEESGNDDKGIVRVRCEEV